MKFHYEFDIKKLTPAITHADRLLLIGSCFTEAIGEKLNAAKFTVLQNPSGILFNPVSVTQTLIDCIEGEEMGEEELFQYQEGWHSWKHHSRFSHLQKEEALLKIKWARKEAHSFLKQTDILLITLGSSWVYSLTDKAIGGREGLVVANNHKAPANWFERRLLTTEAVLENLDGLIHRLFHFNKKLRIIFTISPVRHLREGVVENNRSKAVLITAVHHLVNKFDRLYYFPAYELVIDDLRDYRFYAEDLVHPNYAATNYVWEKFTAACIDEKARKLMDKIHAINASYRHKPFAPESEEHKKFLGNALQKIREVQLLEPGLNFDREIAYFESGHH